ncbi:MAG TPA: hypothetical protein ENH34_05525 [Phycisphaerales bacterium]|nr:hypothetical protein [Phycisphaerales bacterium]
MVSQVTNNQPKTIKLTTEVNKVAQELKSHLFFVPEGQLEALTILQGLLPDFEEERHMGDIKTIGGIVEYAKAHSDFETNWCSSLDFMLKRMVEALWSVEPAVRVGVVKKLIESRAALVETRAKMPIAKERVYGIYDKLDLHTKLLIGIGVELQRMDGVNIDTFSDVLDQFNQQADELIAQARKDPEISRYDKDAMYLCDLFELAETINRES